MVSYFLTTKVTTMKKLIVGGLLAVILRTATQEAKAQSPRKVIIATAYCTLVPGASVSCAVWGWFYLRIQSGFGGAKFVQVSPMPETPTGKLSKSVRWKFTYEDGEPVNFSDQLYMQVNAIEQ